MKTRDKILSLINEYPGLTLTELSLMLLKTKGNISIHLTNLEKQELVIKCKTEENRKNFRLHPTKKGKEIYLKMKLEMIV